MRLFITAGFLLLAALPLTARPAAAATTYAVLVSVSDYGIRSWNLEAPRNDLELMRDLCREWGIPASRTFVLQDAAAKREALVSTLRYLAGLVKKGDRVLFYFTGHAVEVADFGRGPRDEADGNDEALVLAPAARGAQPALLVDDDLNPLLAALRARGAQTACIFDCCFSYDGIKDPGEGLEYGKEKTIHGKLSGSPWKAGSGSGRAPRVRSNALLLSAGSARQTTWEVLWRVGRQKVPISPLTLSIWATASQAGSWTDLLSRVSRFHRSRGIAWQPALQGLPVSWQRPSARGAAAFALHNRSGGKVTAQRQQLRALVP